MKFGGNTFGIQKFTPSFQKTNFENWSELNILNNDIPSKSISFDPFEETFWTSNVNVRNLYNIKKNREEYPLFYHQK